MDTWEIVIIVIGSCCFVAYMAATFHAMMRKNVFGFKSVRSFRRAVHEIYVLFIGYVGRTKYSIDEFYATYFLLDYYKWSRKREKYKIAHPLSYGNFSISLFEKCGRDFPLAFCISAINQYVSYGDAIKDFLGFYVMRCGVRSEFGSYCARFHNEWVTFWDNKAAEFEKVGVLVGRDNWERGFVFDDIPSEIAETERRELIKYLEIESKYNC